MMWCGFDSVSQNDRKWCYIKYAEHMMQKITMIISQQLKQWMGESIFWVSMDNRCSIFTMNNWICTFINPGHLQVCVYVCMCMCVLSHVWLFVTPWSSPVSSVHGICQIRYWSGLPFPPPGDLSDPGIKPASLTSPALTGGFFTTCATGKPISQCIC